MNVPFLIFKSLSNVMAALPFRMLYGLSAILAFLLHYVIRYRRTVIYRNLRHSFPEKPTVEIGSIAGEYYKNLGDITLEIIKLGRVRPGQLKKRVEFVNHELLSSALDSGKSAIIAIGHCGNWEWMGTALGLVTPQKGYALTKPLSDKDFHQYMEKIRHRLNPDSTIPFKSAFREMVRRREEPSFYVIAADQTPTMDEANYWTEFLNQDTPFFMGIEKIARSLDHHVIFMDIQRTGKGRYRGVMQLVTGDPVGTREGEITEKYVKMLEEAIRSAPANWLWSHRRWKHKRPGKE
jgi:KDO2-lipid IV(A) lauroyltransferase